VVLGPETLYTSRSVNKVLKSTYWVKLKEKECSFQGKKIKDGKSRRPAKKKTT